MVVFEKLVWKTQSLIEFENSILISKVLNTTKLRRILKVAKLSAQFASSLILASTHANQSRGAKNRIQRFYLPHTARVKQDVVFIKGNIVSAVFFFYWSLCLYVSVLPFLVFRHLVLTHFLLVVDSKTLCIEPQLRFHVFLLIEKLDKILVCSLHVLIKPYYGFIKRDDVKSCHWQLGIEIGAIFVAWIQLS